MILVVSSLGLFPELMWNACMSVRAVWKNGKKFRLCIKEDGMQILELCDDFAATVFRCVIFFIDFLFVPLIECIPLPCLRVCSSFSA